MPLRSNGSLSLNRSLMAAGLVDYVQVTIFPVITGQTGIDPIFGGAADFDLERYWAEAAVALSNCWGALDAHTAPVSWTASTYYRDETKPTGWNNLVFPNIGMPHPLWELQGEREPVMETVTSHGQETKVFKSWAPVKAGTLSATEYDQNVGDLVAYLQWMAEPAANARVRLGVWVLLFLAVFTVVAWRLNAAYWKDVK